MLSKCSMQMLQKSYKGKKIPSKGKRVQKMILIDTWKMT